MAKAARISSVITEIERLVDITHPPIKLVEIAAKAVQSLMSEYSYDQSFEYAERNVQRIKKELSNRINSDINARFGYFSSIAISDVSDEYVHGSCYILLTDDDNTRNGKNSRSNIYQIADNIDSLNEHEFEIFCGKLLETLGVENPIVTRSSNDQGIDFFGLWPHQSYLVDSVMPPGMERQLRTWIFGQAKKYNKTVVSTSEIRELVGSVELARSKAFSAQVSDFSGLTVRPCDPVFQFFMTTGRATTGVMELMSRSGTIYMDSHLSAVFLADRADKLDVDFKNNAIFKEWLSANS